MRACLSDFCLSAWALECSSGVVLNIVDYYMSLDQQVVVCCFPMHACLISACMHGLSNVLVVLC